MTKRVTLRELKALLKRSPRLLAEYLVERAEEALNDARLPSQADDHGHAPVREEPKQ